MKEDLEDRYMERLMYDTYSVVKDEKQLPQSFLEVGKVGRSIMDDNVHIV